MAVGSADSPMLTLFEGGNDGTFSPAFELVVPDVEGGFVDLAVADLNNDGQQDVVAASFAAKIVVALGDAPFHLNIFQVIEVGAKPARLLVRDVTADSRLDALIGTDTGIVLLRGHGDGGFNAPETVLSGEPVKDMVLLDVDGDATLDLVAALPQANAVRVYSNMAEGTFTDIPVEQPSALAVAELTSDTRLDIAVLAGDSGDVFVLRGTGAGLAPPFPIASGVMATRLIAADVNGDARTDLIANDATTGTVQTLVGSAKLPLEVVNGGTGSPRTGLVVVDFDCDGVADFVSISPQDTQPEPLPDPLPPALPPLRGDCNHDRIVGTDELIVAVRLALGDGQFVCPSLDGNADAIIGIDDLVAAVENALLGAG